MEFNEKLQQLRKQKGLTQEELAQALFVSRTAISKWESGRGYPNIDSLKGIASFFSVSIDDLLSNEAINNLSEKQRKQTGQRTDRAFGLSDWGMGLLLVLPFFGQEANDGAQAVSLWAWTGVQSYLKAACCVFIMAAIGAGLTAFLRRQSQYAPSLMINGLLLLLLILSRQPYAALWALAMLLVKVWMLIKRR